MRDRLGRKVDMDYLDARTAEIVGLREENEVLRGIVQRVQDGWWPPSDVDPDDADDYQPGWWIGTDGPEESAPEPERMSEAEQIAWYGSVVREEEKSR